MKNLFLLLFSLLCMLSGCAQARPEPSPPPEPITVACVGDSLTYGALLEGSRDTESYPAVLAALLGDGYRVENFGVCGQELLGHSPLTDSQWYQTSLDCRPGVVIFMLGTNDARKASWHSSEEYRSALEEALTAYLTLESSPDVYLCTPAQIFPMSGLAYDPELLAEIAGITRKTAETLELPLIDIYALTEGQAQWYAYDGIHPTAEGYAEIAEAVYSAITGH